MIVCLMILASLFRLPDVDDRRFSLTVIFLACCSLTLGAALWPVNKWIAMFMWLATVSWFYPDYSQDSWETHQNIFFGLTLYYIIVSIFDKSSVWMLYDAIAIIGIGSCVWLILQAFDADPLIRNRFGPYDPLVGTCANPNEASALIAGCFAAYLRPVRRCFIPVLIYGLVLTHSTGGPVAIAAGLLFYGFLSSLTMGFLMLGVSVIGLSGYILFVDVPYMRRFEAFNAMLTRYYPKYPWFGVGLGKFKRHFGPVHIKDVGWVLFNKLLPDKSAAYAYFYAHNEPIQGLMEMGIAFAGILSGYVVNAIRTFRTKAKHSATAMVIIFVSCLYHFGFHIASTAHIFVTWMAIYSIETNGPVKERIP